MSILNRLTVSTVLIATILTAQAAQATTYYVSTTGSDGAAGNDITAPWRTLGHASATMRCGDITLVRGGTYTTEGNIRFRQTTCTAQTPVMMKNYPGESPIVHWPSKTDSNSKIEIYSGSATTPVTDVIIDGLELWGGWEGIKLEGTLRTIIRNNTIHGHETNGITGTNFGGNLNGTIDRNVIYDNGDYTHLQCAGRGVPIEVCDEFHGMYITGTGWIITNNLIYDNLASGIQIAGYPYVAGKFPSSSYATFSGLVANNTIAYQRNNSGIFFWGAGGLVSNTTIENNIFYENAQSQNGSAQAITYVSCDSCTGTVRNNLYYGTSTSTGFSTSSGTNPPARVTVSTTTNVAPRFKNAPASIPASPDFTLQAGSPAIDTGLSVPLVTIDLAGVLRPQGSGHDIGAYEDVSSSNQPPAPPKGLNVF